MGGDSEQTTNTRASQTSNSTISTPGTAFGQSIINDPRTIGLTGDIFGQTANTGPVTAAPTDVGQGNYAAQRGPLPSIFVPQRTATDAPTQVQQTHVDPNYTPGIAAGLEDAEANRNAIGAATPGLYDYWNNIIGGGGENPYLQPVIDAFSTDFNEQSERSRANRALYAGAEGAFGGTPFQQGESWAAEQEAQAYGREVAGLRYEDFIRTQGQMERAPGALADIAELGTLGANQMLQFGNLQQENLAAAAATGDHNAQVLQNNLHQAQQLNDSNAIAAAQDAIARWEAQYAAEQARVADVQGQAATQQEITQAGYDNANAAAGADTDLINTQLEQLMALLGIGRSVPGATTTSSGTSRGTSTTETSQGIGWADIAGLMAAGLQASDRRIKKNIEFLKVDRRGVKWYLFHYLWQDDEDLAHMGVIAQELEEIAPQFVHTNKGLKVVDYDGLDFWEPKNAMVSAA